MSTEFSFKIPQRLAEKINKIANETDKSRSSIIKEAIQSYIEDYYDYKIALERLNNPGDKIISSEELKKTIGLQNLL